MKEDFLDSKDRSLPGHIRRNIVLENLNALGKYLWKILELVSNLESFIYTSPVQRGEIPEICIETTQTTDVSFPSPLFNSHFTTREELLSSKEREVVVQMYHLDFEE